MHHAPPLASFSPNSISWVHATGGCRRVAPGPTSYWSMSSWLPLSVWSMFSNMCCSRRCCQFFGPRAGDLCQRAEPTWGKFAVTPWRSRRLHRTIWGSSAAVSKNHRAISKNHRAISKNHRAISKNPHFFPERFQNFVLEFHNPSPSSLATFQDGQRSEAVKELAKKWKRKMRLGKPGHPPLFTRMNPGPCTGLNKREQEALNLSYGALLVTGLQVHHCLVGGS